MNLSLLPFFQIRAFKDWLEKALEIQECFFDLGKTSTHAKLASFLASD